MDQLESGRYYCYILRYPRVDGLWFEPDQPFYVGKGSGDRAWHHLRRYAQDGNAALTAEIQRLLDNELELGVEIVWDDMAEPESFQWERFLIQHWGRRHLGGLLMNISKGGQGGTRLSDGSSSDSRIEQERRRRFPKVPSYRGKQARAERAARKAACR